MEIDLPTGDTETDRFARELALLRGPEVSAADGTLVAASLRTQGETLANARAVVLRAVAQAHPGSAASADGLLAELETQYGLPSGAGLSDAARQQRVLAKVRARRAATENAILATVRTFAPTATITGFAWSDVTALPRNTHRFAVVVPAAIWNSPTRARIVDAVEQQKPAHVEALVTVTVGFRYDDADSLLDRDLLSV